MSLPSKKLKAAWDLKLKQSGFKDAEDKRGMLKVWSNRKMLTKHHNPILTESKREYYRLVGHFLYDYEHFTKETRLIWSLHSDGLDLSDIAKELKKHKINIKRSTVGARIQALAKIMLASKQVSYDTE